MFNWGMVVWAVLLISCKNTGATTSDGATDSTQVTSVEQILKLPALKPGEEIVFEDDKVRIVEGGIVNTDGGMYNTLNMQPKNAEWIRGELSLRYLSSPIPIYSIYSHLYSFCGVAFRT